MGGGGIGEWVRGRGREGEDGRRGRGREGKGEEGGRGNGGREKRYPEGKTRFEREPANFSVARVHEFL